jgi:hypothetical protein
MSADGSDPDEYRKFSSPEEGFSLQVPIDWIEVPEPAMKSFREKVGRYTGKSSPYNYRYAFQPKIVEDWFSSTYLLIGVETGKRMSISGLKQLRSSKDADTSRWDFQSIAANIPIGGTFYDEPTQSIWFFRRIEQSGSPNVLVMTLSFLTEEGFIYTGCYFREEEADRYMSVCRDILATAQLDPEKRYSSGIMDYVPYYYEKYELDHVVNMLIGATIAVGLYGVFRHLRGRSKKK